MYPLCCIVYLSETTVKILLSNPLVSTVDLSVNPRGQGNAARENGHFSDALPHVPGQVSVSKEVGKYA